MRQEIHKGHQFGLAVGGEEGSGERAVGTQTSTERGEWGAVRIPLRVRGRDRPQQGEELQRRTGGVRSEDWTFFKCLSCFHVWCS